MTAEVEIQRGILLPVSAHASPVENAGAADPTSEQLMQKVQLLQMALDASMQGVLITAPTGEILLHNRYLLRLFGFSEDIFVNETARWKDALSRRLKDPDRMLRALAQIEGQVFAETLDIFELVDGRLVECRTRFQMISPAGEYCRLWIFVDCTEQQRRERELQHMSSHDTLTGVYNRAFFDARMRQIRCTSEYPVCMVMVDIDGLKQVNDWHGHSAGDEILRQASRILCQACRSEDMVARLGGDEFGVLLGRAGVEEAEQVVNRIYGLINLYNIRFPDAPLSLSMGYAIANNSQEVDDLFVRADETMYESRRRKRCTNPR